jgi:hypothetical protein
MAISEFGKAFREARNSGEKTFTWRGKKYTTELAEEKSAKRKKEEKPEEEKLSKKETDEMVNRISREEPRKYTREELINQIPTGGYSEAPEGESASGSELGRNFKNTLMALGPGKLAGVGNIGVEMVTAKRVQDAYNRAAAARREAEGFSPAEAIARRNLMDEAAAAGGMKRGGKVKAKPVKKMASGGMARSSASKRADGIATKGKTRGKIY